MQGCQLVKFVPAIGVFCETYPTQFFDPMGSGRNNVRISLGNTYPGKGTILKSASKVKNFLYKDIASSV